MSDKLEHLVTISSSRGCYFMNAKPYTSHRRRWPRTNWDFNLVWLLKSTISIPPTVFIILLTQSCFGNVYYASFLLFPAVKMGKYVYLIMIMLTWSWFFVIILDLRTVDLLGLLPELGLSNVLNTTHRIYWHTLLLPGSPIIIVGCEVTTW